MNAGGGLGGDKRYSKEIMYDTRIYSYNSSMTRALYQNISLMKLCCYVASNAEKCDWVCLPSVSFPFPLFY